MNKQDKIEVNRKMKEADKRSFNELATIIKRLKKDKKLYDSYTKDYENGIAEITFIHRLRNSLAHSGKNGLRFYPIRANIQEINSIESIIFGDEERNGKGEEFIAELSVQQVERVLECIISMFSKYQDFEDKKDYQDIIDEKRKKMKSQFEAELEFNVSVKGLAEEKYSSCFKMVRAEGKVRRGHVIVFEKMIFWHGYF